jgi:hypothetical protein
MARLLRMMYEIKKADNKNGARSSLDIQIEGYIEEVSGRLKEARQSGTALLLIVLLVTILEVAVRLGSSRVPQLSFAVDKALEPLSSARGLSVLVDVLRVRKERARNLSRQLAG